MKSLSLDRFIEHLALVKATLPEREAHAVLDAAKLIQTEAKAEIGHYQDAAGPFPAWAPLADTTLNGWRGHPGKIELGYAPPDNPLLRTGEMRDSIEVSHHGNEASVGSNSDVAVWQEFGTNKIPPRSFLGRAAFVKGEAAANLIGKEITDALAGIPRSQSKQDGRSAA